jgi:uncharacterized protein
MILVDTGPLVALFDRKDPQHRRCEAELKKMKEPIRTTVAVLTEAFHMLGPASPGSEALREFVTLGGLSIWWFDSESLGRAFELMEEYADRPMDLADASLVVAAELLKTRKIFTIDRDDFETYRVRLGHRRFSFEILPRS